MFSAGAELKAARKKANLSIRDLATLVGRPASTIARIEVGVTNPRTDVLDELLRACGRRLDTSPVEDKKVSSTPAPQARTAKKESQMKVLADPPSTYPNPRGDDPWDNDAVHYLLDQPDVAASFKRGPLMECLRRQPNRLKNQPQRVEEAAELARRHGVIQKSSYNADVGKTIVRLIRTDPGAPSYPAERA